MSKKVLGYTFSALGIIGISLSFFEEAPAPLSQFIPSQITPFLLYIGIALVILGVFFITRSRPKRQKGTEVPIYHGKEIVGYRRT